MKKKMIILFVMLFTLLTTGKFFAGTINWLYVGFGYLGANPFVYDLSIGTGQMFDLGKIVVYTAENFNMVYTAGVGSGYGANGTFDIGYKVIGGPLPDKGFELIPLFGAFVEADLYATPPTLQLAYGPELGANFAYYFTPGFGLELQVKAGFNLTGWQNSVFPFMGLAMVWRPFDPDKIKKAKKKNAKTSELNAGVYKKGNTVMFVFESDRDDIRSVAITGDFDNWDPKGISLQEEGGVWKVVLKLEQGVYQYKYIINGTEKIADPAADGFSPDGEGGKNAVIEIE